LHDERRPLDLLDADGDAHTGVRAVFTWSYRALPGRAARVFRLLGVHPGREYEAYAVAAISGLPLDDARGALSTLADAHLIERIGDGRYAMHDLLRAYAIECTDDAEQGAAFSGLIGLYVDTTAAAMDLRYPAERHLRPERPSTSAGCETPVPHLDDADAAGRWLEAERGNLVAVCVGAPDGSGQVARLCAIIGRHLSDNGYPGDALAVHQRAFEVSAAAGDRRGVGNASMDLGFVYWHFGDNSTAAEHFERALEAFRDAQDQRGQARALNNLAIVDCRLGRYDEAVKRILRVFRITHALGDRIGEARALNNLGIVRMELGRYADAAENFDDALKIAESIGDRTGEALAHGNLGDIHFRAGAYRDAVVHYERTRELFHSTGQREGEARSMIDISNVQARLGRHNDAETLRRAALEIFRDIHDDDGTALALNGIAESHLTLLDHRMALEYAADALNHFRRLGSRRGEVMALVTLGTAMAVSGDLKAAVAHFEEARAGVNTSELGALTASVHNGLGGGLFLLGRGDEAFAHYDRVLRSPEAADDPYERSRAHEGIAEIRYAAGEFAAARRHRLCALAGYDELGVPEADVIRGRLGAEPSGMMGADPH
jgi:tetratricopeptide (TPR) repeat protein